MQAASIDTLYESFLNGESTRTRSGHHSTIGHAGRETGQITQYRILVK